jgi:hypothetical protein
LVPRLFLGQTIWAEDVVQALRAMGRCELLHEFNIPLLHAMCLCFNPEYAREILHNFIRQLRLPETTRVTWQVRFAFGYLYAWSRRLSSLTSNLSILASIGSDKMIYNIKDSEAAMTALTIYLREKNSSFRRCVEL